MGIAPWGALGGGKFKSEEQHKSSEGRQEDYSEVDIKTSQVLEALAKRKKTAITSIALAYVMHKAPHVFPIVGGRKIDHLKGNIEALTIRLSQQDIEEIDKAVPFELGFPHSFLWPKGVPESSGEIWLLNTAATYDYIKDTPVRNPSAMLEASREMLSQWRVAHHTPEGRAVGRPLKTCRWRWCPVLGAGELGIHEGRTCASPFCFGSVVFCSAHVNPRPRIRTLPPPCGLVELHVS